MPTSIELTPGCATNTSTTSKILLLWKNNTWSLKTTCSPRSIKSSELIRASTSSIDADNPTASMINANNSDITKSVACNSTLFLHIHQNIKTMIMQPSIPKE